MTKKTRLIILIVCVACFFIIAPLLVFYSMGYRFDFKKIKVTETGGIYVRSFPAADEIIIDGGIKEKPGIFSNSIFVQSLMPYEHSVLVKKNGYYDYSKTISVVEEQVTKLENILLFKTNIQFEIAKNTTISPFINHDKFIIKNNNLYYSTDKQNSSLTTLQKATPIIKKLVTFTQQNNSIIWLGTNGLLYKSDSSNLTTTQVTMTSTPIKIDKTSSYKIINNGEVTFLIAGNNLLKLNSKTNDLDIFYNGIKDAMISSDGKNIIFHNENNIYISLLADITNKKISIYKSPTSAEASAGKSDKITDCLWMNDSYIIFTTGNKIIISEIDYRGKINYTTLPETIIISPTETISLKNPQIFFNSQDSKLYILNDKILLSSERLIP